MRTGCRMWEVTMSNYTFKYQTPYQLLVARRYPEANFAIVNINELVGRSQWFVHNNPAEYLARFTR